MQRVLKQQTDPEATLSDVTSGGLTNDHFCGCPASRPAARGAGLTGASISPCRVSISGACGPALPTVSTPSAATFWPPRRLRRGVLHHAAGGAPAEVATDADESDDTYSAAAAMRRRAARPDDQHNAANEVCCNRARRRRRCRRFPRWAPPMTTIAMVTVVGRDPRTGRLKDSK